MPRKSTLPPDAPAWVPEDRRIDEMTFACSFLEAYPMKCVHGKLYTVETVVLLSREKVDGHISIDLDVEKLESKSGTATYAEIKAYIEKKYGYKVSSLYIGQIKDKAGIKERKNYNTGSGNGRVPTCPPEKEEAIMDAFRHFNLI